jgi:hypothetical protein
VPDEIKPAAAILPGAASPEAKTAEAGAAAKAAARAAAEAAAVAAAEVADQKGARERKIAGSILIGSFILFFLVAVLALIMAHLNLF